MTWETYSLYLVVVAVFFATPPGTSQLLMISNSIRHGVRRSLATVAGDLSANALQMSAAAFGLATIIATSVTSFQVIKWCGVLYLLWIGLCLMISKPQQFAEGDDGSHRIPVLFRQGFLTSSANPYAIIFFAALFPQFIDSTATVWPQLLALGTTYLIVDGATLILWGGLAVKAFEWVGGLTSRRVNLTCGALMIGAATLLAWKNFDPGAA